MVSSDCSRPSELVALTVSAGQSLGSKAPGTCPSFCEAVLVSYTLTDSSSYGITYSRVFALTRKISAALFQSTSVGRLPIDSPPPSSSLMIMTSSPARTRFAFDGVARVCSMDALLAVRFRRLCCGWKTLLTTLDGESLCFDALGDG